MEPYLKLRVWKRNINFYELGDDNIDSKTINSFGSEWESFSKFNNNEINYIAKDYFDIVQENDIKNKIILDAGCGNGRWSIYLIDKVKYIELIDPSSSVFVAAELLKDYKNISINNASISNLPFENEYFDFIMSLGVVHHMPDINLAIKSLSEKLKRNGKILLYIYYNLENTNLLYKILFYLSNFLRKYISKLPFSIKKIICELIAIIIYFPFAKFAKFLEKLKLNRISKMIPLEYYKDKKFVILRNDALDRFGTPLENRFSKEEIESILLNNNFKDIIFSKRKPYYHVIATKK